MDAYLRSRAWLRSTSGPFRRLLCSGVVSVVVSFATGCIVTDPLYCSSNAECVQENSDGPALICHPNKHTCLPFQEGTCATNADCTSPSASRCQRGADDTDGQCMPCQVGNPNDKSCASLLGDSAQCAEVDGVAQCIECRANIDCPSDRPICDTNKCRTCREHKDCEGELKCDGNVLCTDSMVCIREGDLSDARAGSCARNESGSTGRVIYAHNGNPNCSDVNPAYGFRFSEPVCSLTRALDLVQSMSRRYVRVLGSSYDPVNKSIASGVMSFIGAPGKNYPTMATMKGRGLLFDVQDDAVVTIEQLDMTEQNVNAVALSCAGNLSMKIPTLNLLRSFVRGSTTPAFANALNPALRLTECNARIEQNVIGLTTVTESMSSTAAAHGVGIRVTDQQMSTKTGYRIENNLIAGNISTGIDVSTASAPTQRFLAQFNTIAYNGRQTATRAGGLLCYPFVPMNRPAFSNNIFFGNMPYSGSQIAFGPSCIFANNVVGSGDTCQEAGLRKFTPEFDEQFALSDTSANRTCCIDQATPAQGDSFPLLDVRYLTRPSGTSYDIGAFELQQSK